MDSTGIEGKPPPNPLQRRGRMKPLPQPLSQGEGSNMQIDLANALVCTLFVLPSFGGVGGGSQWGDPLWGGRTTYLYLIKIKIHLMINSLVCVPSPFQGKPPPAPPKEGRRSLSPFPSPKERGVICK